MLITVDKADGVALVTLNRPEAMNALSLALRAELCAAMAELDEDNAIGAVILTGAGGRAFCAGLDMKELAAGTAIASAGDAAPPANPVAAVERCRKPVIAAVNGVAVTGGLELALACDILIASETARFADTHAKVGLLPGWGLSQKLSRLIGIYRAREMTFSGALVDAATAEAWGLINRVVAPHQLIPAARALATQIAAFDRGVVADHKHLINTGFGMPLDDALAFERDFARQRNRARREQG